MSGVEMSYFVSEIGHLDPRFYSLIYCAIPGVQISRVEMSGVEMSGVKMSGVHCPDVGGPDVRFPMEILIGAIHSCRFKILN